MQWNVSLEMLPCKSSGSSPGEEQSEAPLFAFIDKVSWVRRLVLDPREFGGITNLMNLDLAK